MKSISISLILIANIAILSQCSDSNPNSLNPNGDSELALLMREMFEDGMRTKQLVLDGKSPEVKVAFQKMHTATATEPEKVADPNYAAMTTVYENSVNTFLTSPDHSRVESYTNMVNACMNCHQVVCPGPMRKIKKMYLSEQEIAVIGER